MVCLQEQKRSNRAGAEVRSSKCEDRQDWCKLEILLNWRQLWPVQGSMNLIISSTLCPRVKSPLRKNHPSTIRRVTWKEKNPYFPKLLHQPLEIYPLHYEMVRIINITWGQLNNISLKAPALQCDDPISVFSTTYGPWEPPWVTWEQRAGTALENCWVWPQNPNMRVREIEWR